MYTRYQRDFLNKSGFWTIDCDARPVILNSTFIANTLTIFLCLMMKCRGPVNSSSDWSMQEHYGTDYRVRKWGEATRQVSDNLPNWTRQTSWTVSFHPNRSHPVSRGHNSQFNRELSCKQQAVRWCLRASGLCFYNSVVARWLLTETIIAFRQRVPFVNAPSPPPYFERDSNVAKMSTIMSFIRSVRAIKLTTPTHRGVNKVYYDLISCEASRQRRHHVSISMWLLWPQHMTSICCDSNYMLAFTRIAFELAVVCGHMHTIWNPDAMYELCGVIMEQNTQCDCTINNKC
jgi:hypothetical protein